MHFVKATKNRGLRFLKFFFLSLLLVSGLHAAPILWVTRDIDGENGFGDASVSTNGTLIEAANFGGSAVTSPTINTVPFTGIDFTSGESPTSLSGLTYDNSEFGSGISGIGEIDPLLEEIALLRNRGVQNTTLTGLVIGKRYEVQFFISFDINRTYRFDDKEGNIVSIRAANPAQFVTGTFIADAETQDIEMRSSTGSHFLNGYQLREIPLDLGDTIEVTTLTDQLNSPSGEEISLREAIRDVNPGGVITFAPSLNGGTIALEGRSLGQLEIEKPLSIDASALPNGIKINGGSNGFPLLGPDEVRCFFISDGDNNRFIEVTFTNLTIEKGVTDVLRAGANIHNRENLTLTNCRILDGQAVLRAGGTSIVHGGGVYHERGELTMIDCVVSRNMTSDRITATRALGAGVFIRDGNATMTRCSISNNENLAPQSEGGGIYVLDGDLTMIDCIINGNTTLDRERASRAQGVGIYHRNGDLTMTRCTISSNESLAPQSEGKGIYHQNGSLTMIDCTVSGNRSSNRNGPTLAQGAGIFKQDGDLTMTGCTISNNLNRAPRSEGAGIFHRSGNLSMTRCTVSNNQNGGTQSRGSGIFNDTNFGTHLTQLTRCTISGNTSPGVEGGGVFNESGRLTLEHCTIAANVAAEGEGAGIANNNASGVSTEISNCIIQDSIGGPDIAIENNGSRDSFTFSGSNLIGVIGANITGISPNLEPIRLFALKNYGGRTQTMPPLFGSPAINAALDSEATEDQRGVPITGVPDIGATEFQSMTVTTLNDELALVASDGEGVSLREAIRDVGLGGVVLFDPDLNGGVIQLDTALGELTVDRSLAIDASPLSAGIIIDGGSNGDFVKDPNETRCFFVSDSNSNTRTEVVFINLTVRNGVFEGDSAGANIRNEEDLTLTACRILDGLGIGANATGGGILHRNGDLTMNLCVVSGNRTQGVNADGGGISSSRGKLFMMRCTISDNQTLDDNSQGAGIHNVRGRLTMTDCTVSGNRTEGNGSDGGGVFHDNGNLTMMRCTISGNETQKNVAEGGGIYSETTLGETTTRLVQCTITANRVGRADGGGVFNFGGRTEIEHCTIVENSTGLSSTGAGIGSNGNADTQTAISNTIVRDNLTGPDLALFRDDENSFEFPSEGRNLIGTLGRNVTGTTANPGPILLAPLADYGGLTKTMPPLPGSPAVDAAINSTSAEDQREFPTIGTPDIGAAELQGTTLTDEPILLFDFDSDKDGLTNGLESAIGSDPDLADFDHPGRPRIAVIDGTPTFIFGIGVRFGPREIRPEVIIERSETLLPGSFEVIARLQTRVGEPPSLLFEAGVPLEIEVSRDDLLMNIEDNTPAESAFYRMKAVVPE